MNTGEISVEGVSRRFRIRARDARTLKDLFVQRGQTEATDVWALRDVSLDVARGEAVGLIGRNGSGKTTLLRVVAGIIKPTAGRVRAEGRIGSLLELGAGFHPDFTGRENVFLNGAIYGLRRADIRQRFDEIVAFAELEHAIDRPVRTYSSGMTVRLGFAIAAFLDADVLLLDEVFAVGDESFQRKCFGRISRFKQEGGTIVFVSHDAVRSRAAVRALGAPGRRPRRIRRLRRARRSRATGAPWRTRPIRPSAAPGCASGDRARRRSRPLCSSDRKARERLQFLSGEPFALSRCGRRRRRRPAPAAPARASRRRRHPRGRPGGRPPRARLGGRRTASGGSASRSARSRSPTGASISGWV